MRAAILIILSLALLTAASAADKSEWVYSGDPIEFQGTTYYAYLDTSRTSSFIESNDTSMIVRLGQCRVENFVRICFTEVANSSNTEWFTYDSNNQPLYGSRYTFESLGPNVQAEHWYSTTSPDLNERVDGEIEVRNTGNQDAVSIRIEVDLNASVRMHTCGDCSVTPRGFTKEFTQLKPDETESVSFAFIVEDAESFSSTASISYEHDGVTASAGPLTQDFTIQSPYDVSLTSSGTVAVGEWTEMRLTIRNTGDNPISANAPRIENGSLSYGTLGTHRVEDLEGITLEAGEEFTHDYRVRSTRAGTYRTGHSVSITRGENTFEEEVHSEPTWRLQNVRITTQLSKTKPTAGDTNHLYIGIENAADITFRNLEVVYTGEEEGSESIESLRAGAQHNVLELPFTHTSAETSEERAFNVSLRYETQFGEEQVESTRAEYTVVSVNESYQLRRELQPREPAIGEEFTVTVYGRKMTDSAVQYSEASDQVIGARVLRGSHRSTTRSGSEEIRLYQYEAVREDERFALITSVDASFRGEEAQITDVYATFNLSEEEIEETIESNTTQVEEEEGIVQEEDEREATRETVSDDEPGFFGRIMDWFRGLFG